MRAVDAIMECLKAEGGRACSGIPGGANLPTYDALDAGIRHVQCRHEQGLGAAEELRQGLWTGRRGARHVGGATNLVTRSPTP